MTGDQMTDWLWSSIYIIIIIIMMWDRQTGIQTIHFVPSSSLVTMHNNIIVVQFVLHSFIPRLYDKSKALMTHSTHFICHGTLWWYDRGWSFNGQLIFWVDNNPEKEIPSPGTRSSSLNNCWASIVQKISWVEFCWGERRSHLKSGEKTIYG